MKQVISFSLYGTEMRFLVGAIKNAVLAERFFPGFTVRYYVGKSVPYWVLSTLMLHKDVEVIQVDKPEDNLARMWRFMAVLDEDVDVVLSRDVDARLSLREAEAHQEFMESRHTFHIMRDHPTGHGYLISAGMFAVKTKDIKKDFQRAWDSAHLVDTYMQDQNFMTQYIYPLIANRSLIHDEYYNYETMGNSEKRVIERKRKSQMSHIGCAIDENDVFVYHPDRNVAILESKHVSYIYDWGNDEDSNNGK